VSERQVTFSVFRYRPEQDGAPSYSDYQVPCRPDWVVLDALNYIKDHLDPTLSYRWSCHMAVCGSCGMMINDEPQLACKAFIRDLPATIRVAPLDHLPVVRDLIVDQARLIDGLGAVKAWLIPDRPPPGDTYRQTPAEFARYHQWTLCINCMLCYAACPQVGLSADYHGPAALALAQRYNQDSRDGGHRQRAAQVAGEQGIWECTFVGECSSVCPNQVDPAAAIQQLKLASSVDWLTEWMHREHDPKQEENR